MEQKIIVTIATPHKILFKEEVSSLTMPGEGGEFSVLPSHEALISILKSGIVTAVANNTKVLFFIDGGIARVKNNKIELLADFGINIENIVKRDIDIQIGNLENDLAKVDNSELRFAITKDLKKYQSLLSYL